jgi:hypothetical protein
VRHLVQDRLGAPLPAGFRDLRPEDILLQEGHAAGVLHRPGVELGDEQLVVLAERVAVVEHPVVEVETGLGDVEDLIGVEELRQRAPAVNAEVDAVVGVPDLVIRPGDQRGDVRGHHRRRLEPPGQRVGVGVTRLHHCAVRYASPRRGRSHGQREDGLQVGLVEAGVHAVRVVRLELGVEVYRVVHRGDEAVQALARPGVDAVRDDGQPVRLEQAVQPDPAPVEHPLRVEVAAVEHHLVDPGSGELDERRRPGLGAGERYGGGRDEGLLAAGQVKRYLVGGHVQQTGAVARLVAGEVVGHPGPFGKCGVASGEPARRGATLPAVQPGVAAASSLPRDAQGRQRPGRSSPRVSPLRASYTAYVGAP